MLILFIYNIFLYTEHLSQFARLRYYGYLLSALQEDIKQKVKPIFRFHELKDLLDELNRKPLPTVRPIFYLLIPNVIFSSY